MSSRIFLQPRVHADTWKLPAAMPPNPPEAHRNPGSSLTSRQQLQPEKRGRARVCTSDGRHPSGGQEKEEEEGPRRYICGSEGNANSALLGGRENKNLEKTLPRIIESECLFDKSMSEYGRRIPHPLIPFDNLRANHAFVLPRADQTFGSCGLGGRKEGCSCAVTQAHTRTHRQLSCSDPEQIPRIHPT